MNTKTSVVLFALLVFASLLALSIWASLQVNLMVSIHDLLAAPATGNNPWLLATLADAYFGFLWFWLWVLYREARWIPRFIWLVLILLLGNLAMAAYVLLTLCRLPANASLADLFQPSARS